MHKVYQKSVSEYNSTKSKNFHKLGLLLDLFKSTLDEIDKEISIHENKVNELYALRQAILDDVHHIGRDNFEFLERQIMYSFMQKVRPTSVSELTQSLNENEIAVRNSIKKLADKFRYDETSIFNSLKKR